MRTDRSLALLLPVLLSSCGLLRIEREPPHYEDFRTESGIAVQDLVVAEEGPPVEVGDEVTIHYAGWLADGELFDSSFDRGRPITFVIGAGEVFPGLEEGLLGMRTGGRRSLVIPAELGYGAEGIPGFVPPDAVLLLDVELMGLAEAGEAADEPDEVTAEDG